MRAGAEGREEGGREEGGRKGGREGESFTVDAVASALLFDFTRAGAGARVLRLLAGFPQIGNSFVSQNSSFDLMHHSESMRFVVTRCRISIQVDNVHCKLQLRSGRHAAHCELRRRRGRVPVGRV